MQYFKTAMVLSIPHHNIACTGDNTEIFPNSTWSSILCNVQVGLGNISWLAYETDITKQAYQLAI